MILSKRTSAEKAIKLLNVFLLACILLIFMPLQLYGQTQQVPGTVVDYIPASTKTYIGSPSICFLSNGDYIASHDHFGPESTEHQQAHTTVFRSTDKGKSWKKISEINGQFWSNLFVHNGDLHIMGTWKHHGNLIIRKSADGGFTWTEPSDSRTGLIREGEYHTAPMPMVIHDGRIWRAVENAKSFTTAWGIRYGATVFSAPVESDLLNASSWTNTNSLAYDSAYLDGRFRGWLEGNAVVTPGGQIVNILRVATTEPGRDLAAIVDISDDGLKASFDPANGFIDFVGGARKFSVRFDEKSRRYWTICNMIPEGFADMNAGSVRNILIIKSSSDLRQWIVHRILLQHPEVKKHGFQYVDWQFDGRDIIYLSRTAWDDEFGGANNYHDANYLTFHRIKNYRKLVKRNIQ